MTAHYFASRTRKELIIARGPSIRLDCRVAVHEVSGKAEARKIAAQYCATCWNF